MIAQFLLTEFMTFEIFADIFDLVAQLYFPWSKKNQNKNTLENDHNLLSAQSLKKLIDIKDSQHSASQNFSALKASARNS